MMTLLVCYSYTMYALYPRSEKPKEYSTMSLKHKARLTLDTAQAFETHIASTKVWADLAQKRVELQLQGGRDLKVKAQLNSRSLDACNMSILWFAWT